MLLPSDDWSVVWVSLKEEIGARIRMARLKGGLKIADLARALNVPRQTVVAWETGAGDLSVDDLTRVSLAVGASSLALLGLPDPEGKEEAVVALQAAAPLLAQLDAVPPHKDNLDLILGLVTSMAKTHGREEARKLVLEMFDVIDEARSREDPQGPGPEDQGS